MPGFPVTDRRHSTSQSEWTPQHGFGDVGTGGKVIGIAGFDLPGGDPTDGQVPTWDAASGEWIWSTPGASSTGMVPYYVEVGATFTVPIYKQALFTEPIEVDGALVVNGILLGVD